MVGYKEENGNLPASEKQKNYIKFLIDRNHITVAQASAAIDALKGTEAGEQDEVQ